MIDDDILDLGRLIEAYENDVASIANLLMLARETEKRYIGALRDAIARNDLGDVARAAHSIKGSASNIGAANVSRTAASIEDRARQHTWDGIAASADELDVVYAELCERISAYAAQVL